MPRITNDYPLTSYTIGIGQCGRRGIRASCARGDNVSLCRVVYRFFGFFLTGKEYRQGDGDRYNKSEKIGGRG